MLQQKVGGKVGLKKSASKNTDLTKLFLDIGNFDFSLKNTDESIKRIKKILIKHLGANGCSIMFLDKYGYLWKIGEKTTYPFKIGEGVAGWAAKCKKTVFIEDITKDKRYKPLRNNTKGGIASIPILGGEDVLGILNLTYLNGKLPKEDKIVIDLFAVKLKSILENIILYHESQQERNELSLKRGVARILESELSLKQKIQEIKKMTVKFLEVDNGFIYLIDPKNRRTQIFIEDNSKRKILTKIWDLYNQEKGEKRDFFDLSETLDFEFISKNKTGHITMFPIFSGRRMIGFILLEDATKNIENFSILEKNFIKAISNKIGRYITSELSSKKIIEEKERWRTVFHNVDDGIVLLSRNKVIIEANLKAREVLGMKNASLAGTDLFSMFEIINPEVEAPTLTSIRNLDRFNGNTEDLERRIDLFFKTFKTIRPREYYIQTKKGKFWVIISMKTAAENLKTEEIYGIIHIRDITKTKEVEQDKNEFMSMVSHELRTPLSAMKGYLSMALNKDYGELNKRQEKSLRRVQDSSERMVVLVEDILDVSRIELGRFNLHKEPINLTESVCTIVRELGAKIDQKEISVTIQGKKADCCLNETRKTECTIKNLSAYVLVDRDRLMQILQNLIDNAIKYSFDQGKIEIRINSNKKFAEIFIKDYGVGVAKKDQQKLFKRFSRIHNPLSIQAGGTGLGLYITRKLVLAHGGSIDVSSSSGKGTTFTVKLPIAKQLPLI